MKYGGLPNMPKQMIDWPTQDFRSRVVLHGMSDTDRTI